MTARYDDDALIVTRESHPRGFVAFVADLAAMLGGEAVFRSPSDAGIALTDGRAAVSDDGRGYSVGFVSRFDSDSDVHSQVDDEHNAFVDRIIEVVAVVLPGVDVDLLDANDRVIKTVKHARPAA